MGHSDSDPAAHERRPWNAGQKVGAKRPFKPRDVRAIRVYLDEHRRLRDRALFDLGIDSKLRGCDVMTGGAIRNRATVIEKNTGRPVQFEPGKDMRESLLSWLLCRKGAADSSVFPSRVDCVGHSSIRQRENGEHEHDIGRQPHAAKGRDACCVTPLRNSQTTVFVSDLRPLAHDCPRRCVTPLYDRQGAVSPQGTVLQRFYEKWCRLARLIHREPKSGLANVA